MRGLNVFEILTYMVLPLSSGFALPSSSLPPRNATHLFNAIHSSLRQWGSSLNHNGMSYFLASVPAGTQLYHGRATADAVESMEWLAFEPEHAMLFARKVIRNPSLSDEETGEIARQQMEQSEISGWRAREIINELRLDLMAGIQEQIQVPLRPDSEEQSPVQDLVSDERSNGLYDKPPPKFIMKPGFLHTYTTLHPLHLVYIDGMSAGKTSNGTLDSQDFGLLDPTKERHGFSDYGRARDMCSLSREEWGASVDGFLRMESGFEIVLCEFKKHLHLDRVTKVRNFTMEVERLTLSRNDGEYFAYYQAVAARYWGVGKDRVTMHYDTFVSAFASGIDLFMTNSKPRLENASIEELAKLKKSVTDLVLGADWNSIDRDEGLDWQAVADKVILRYSSRLRNLLSTTLADRHNLEEEIIRILQPFIDFDARNSTAEACRCAHQFIPSTAQPASVSYQVVTTITEAICKTLANSLSLLSSESETNSGKVVQAIRDNIAELLDYLDWTPWRQCGTCPNDSICFIPMWPHGGVDDYKNPSCCNATGFMQRRGYWGSWRH